MSRSPDTARLAAAIAMIALAVAISPVPAICFPWSIDMYRGPEIQPFAMAPRVTPADTIPVHGGEPPTSLEQATVKMHNPMQPTPENLARGKVQYDTYCAPCHGESAQGDGPVARVTAKPPTNLIAGVSKDLPDGYIYGAIRDGILTMPASGAEIPVEQRWQIVMYFRSLQQAASKRNVARK
jgi:cbb3-type cytochrome c oxidase subunit III